MVDSLGSSTSGKSSAMSSASVGTLCAGRRLKCTSGAVLCGSGVVNLLEAPVGLLLRATRRAGVFLVMSKMSCEVFDEFFVFLI